MAEDAENTAPQTAITVFRGWLDPGKHVWSPFVIKLEARLRFAGVPYATASGSPRTAPKGKIPYIECRGNLPRLADGAADASWTVRAEEDPPGSVASLGDSTIIIQALVRCGMLPDINARLSPEGQANDMALRALLEDKLYFYHTRERWINNYYTMRDHALWSVPYPMRILVGILAHRKHAAMLDGQGTGRFSDDELRQFKHSIWESIDGLLRASKTRALGRMNAGPVFWLLGSDKPTEADATLFGFIVSVLICTAGPESQELVRGFPVVVEYAERIHERYFPEYEKWDDA